jgi:hypothetical protein
MAVIRTTVLFPTDQGPEIAKRIQEIMPKFPTPDHITLRGPYWKTTLEGLGWTSITEVEPSKMYEEWLRITAFFTALQGIPGFKWTVDFCTEQSDLQLRREKFGY